MAEPSKKEEAEDIEEQGTGGKSKFRSVGKYFLILFLIVGQAFLAYSFVDKNYKEIYGFIDRMSTGDGGSYQLEKLVVNPAATNGKRYLLVELSLELATEDDVERITENKLKVRHTLIEYLSSLTVDQLEEYKQTHRLRDELITIINKAIEGDSVRNLYYTKYVMQ